MKNIIYVDNTDNPIGSGSIENAVEKGIIHRISRVFVFNAQGELLIQKRQVGMKAFPGRWDQSAGGHVDDGESYLAAAQRELAEELGIKGIPLKEMTQFYTEEIIGEKTLKRFNTLYTGNYTGEISLNKSEVSEIQWILPQDLNDWIENSPQDFADGFVISFNEYLKI
jgi:16S rRNA (adenine1518-N6/adenine1519-N6)-dimethyltransferase